MRVVVKRRREERGKQVEEEIKGFDRFMKYNFSASVGTTIYGTLNFKPESNIQSIRHTIKPNISYSNMPILNIAETLFTLVA